MGILRTFMSKSVGEVVVCSGDIQHGSWDYSTDHRLSTIGNFGTKNLYLERKLLSLQVLEGEDAQRHFEAGKDIFGAGKRVLGAMTGGVVGLLIGGKLAQNQNDKLQITDLVCFEAVLADGKRFVALTSPQVFDKFLENHHNARQKSV